MFPQVFGKYVLERPIALGRETFQTGSLSASSIRKAVNVLRHRRP